MTSPRAASEGREASRPARFRSLLTTLPRRSVPVKMSLIPRATASRSLLDTLHLPGERLVGERRLAGGGVEGEGAPGRVRGGHVLAPGDGGLEDAAAELGPGPPRSTG